ncbi:MAG: polyprenyl diphosphate synthase [Candidatus Micrarchaeia archaeon]
MERLPKVLGLIPDGNRRWARKHNIDFSQAYSIGVNKFISFSEWCKSFGVKNITVWAFSTENFKRSLAERRTLFSIYQKVATDSSILHKLKANKARLRVVGNLSLLPARLQDALRNMERQTRQYNSQVINLLIAYGGRDDLLHAAKELVKRAYEHDLEKVNELVFRRLLFSADVPDADLVIRTSGEERLSGFMPWQTSYSELYFSKKLWPDFTKRDLSLALSEYSRRQRRFGR